MGDAARRRRARDGRERELGLQGHGLPRRHNALHDLSVRWRPRRDGRGANTTSRTRRFVEGGFVVPDAKSSVSWIDRDTLLVATDWGPESGNSTMTESGYAFVVKRWTRGTPLASATEVMRGQASDVGVFVGALEDTDGRRLPIAVEADTFFESVSYRLDGAQPQRINLPRKGHRARALSRQPGLHHRRSVARHAAGRADCLSAGGLGSEAPNASVLFAPSQRQSIEGVAITNDAVLVAGFENVRGRILRIDAERRSMDDDAARPADNGLRWLCRLIADRGHRVRGVRRLSDAGHALCAREQRHARARRAFAAGAVRRVALCVGAVRGG